MKIKLAILEKDAGYLNRIVSAFNVKYAEKLEIYSFTDYEIAMNNLEEMKINVFVANDYFDIDVDKIPKRCGFAYLTDSPEIESVKNQMAICKFQKADLIYKQILGIYSENADSISGLKLNDDACKIVAFSSPCGGTGTSTAAAAYAIKSAREGKRVMYLNIEQYSSVDKFFFAEGQSGLSDIIYALKGKKANISLKIESCVKVDSRGVSFFSKAKLPLDLMEMGIEELKRLINEVELTGSYDIIVLDMDFGIDKKFIEIYKLAHNIVMVSDGSEIANEKIVDAYTALKVMEESMDTTITGRMVILYNRFSNKTGSLIEGIELKSLGGAPRYEHATVQQVLEQLSEKDIFAI